MDDDPEAIRYWCGVPECTVSAILDPITKLQKYHSDGTYKIVFFHQIAPNFNRYELIPNFIGPRFDFFFDGKRNEMNNLSLEILGRGTPVLSSYDAFWSYAPSEVPGAQDHTQGAGNHVKADILFNFISKKVIKNKPNLKNKSNL